jgi:hypothetical protein
MSTSTKHIEELSALRLTFDSIDRAIEQMDAGGKNQEITAPNPRELFYNLTRVWPVVRAIVANIAVLPLFKPSWREALRLLVTTLDQLIATVPATDFKAGKDL